MRYFFIYPILLFGSLFLIGQSYPISTIPDELKENAKAVIRLDETFLTLNQYNKLEGYRNVVITIFKPEGDFFSFLPMYYDKHTRIKNFSGKVFDSDGEIRKKFKKGDYKDYSAVPNGTLYSDNRVKIYRYIPTEYPYTIHLNYHYETSNTAFIPDWTPIKAYEIGIEKSTYTFKNESDTNIRKLPLNFDEFSSIVETETSEGFNYSLSNVSPITSEILSPSLEKLVPTLLVAPDKFQLAGNDGEFTDWKEFGKWMYNDLVKNRQDLPQDEVQHIHEMVDKLDTDKEKIKALYQYMQEKTRYINVAIGIGGWQPYPAKYVSEKGYGDCKALSNYMMSLLKEAGIPSNYTVVYGDHDNIQDIQSNFPSMQGNHVILQVPLENDTIWLECTSQKTAFNHLGAFTHDRYAIATNEDGGKIVRTQSFPADKNKEVIHGEGTISSDGKLELSFERQNSGIQYDWVYYIYYKDQQEQLNTLESWYDDIKNAKFNSFSFINDKDNAIFRQDISLNSDTYAQVNGNNMIFPVVPVGRYQTELKRDSSRNLPLQINIGFEDSSIFEISVPKGYKLNYELEPIALETEFGQYSLQVSYDGSKISVERNLIMNEGTFSKEKFNKYVKFRKKIDKADNTKILLEKL